MKLKTKFITTSGLVLILSFSITFYWMSKFQDELVVSQARQQARMLAQQVILTRKWVADHHGVFLENQPGVTENPFLEIPVIFDQSQKKYIKYNPAKVTRELSEYANNVDLWQYKVTSLNPVNPKNQPDEFEKKSLLELEKGADEISAIIRHKKGRTLRLMLPVMTEEACLECHSRHGYKTGDVRGGLSLSISLKQADALISKNNRTLLTFSVGAIVLSILVIYFLIDFFIVRKIKIISNHMVRLPHAANTPLKMQLGGDEIGELSRKFQDLNRRLTESQVELEKTREQIYQSEKLAALGRFSAGIAHEINNPLGGMLNCVKGMKEAPEDQELRSRYIELIEKGLKRIELTLRQLLNLGRSEPLRLREVDVDGLIRECFALMTYNLKRITFEFDLNLNRVIVIDSEALKQVIVNIGLNAIQSIPESGRIVIKSGETDSGIAISIKDDGEGIEEDNIRKIFDPFYSTKGVNEGTGLGLSVTYALVQQMEGRIDVSSTKNKGSSFSIQLPRRKNLPLSENSNGLLSGDPKNDQDSIGRR
ncbi:MAG: DUF3365 domain-containing protein [Deltaproteobacteria bacterium]|jgi:two-component system, NtrC family, sensor kinase|nr:DUF3365 domain-containing protein [Deltaproteobacteria bacterium]MBT4089909.1 DUF3365 domain-containing protein [Deltaproteobacteria bacterium]MBT4263759.1 DUF3365 domain-containing protein [Deltaproteobacteria bacterium]MBT4643342.1 DUF3365 domain-containing protein [Deltaproteobacteria bacterium]MBT6498709.1 DUF3365 domain-containing protein [Deltaproteobacteria bacterium]